MKIAIYGYGNLGRGVECSVLQNNDIELVGVFTRRDPKTVKTLTGVPVFSTEDILDFKDKIDVLILCGGSATDLPEMTPSLAEHFCVVDSFDTHAKIPEHFENVDKSAKKNGKLALISSGWDPGMFSVNRVYASALLPNGKNYTFWGKGVSQGHSDAIRRLDGVIDARQYTVPIEAALEAARSGENPELTTRQKHLRECFVVAEDTADKAKIEEQIKTMPNYFADYDTTVTFITKEEMDKNHSKMSHGGFVICSGKSGIDNQNTNTIEYRLTLDSNPEFTASALVAYARAVDRMSKRGMTGCITVFDVAPADLSALSSAELRANML